MYKWTGMLNLHLPKKMVFWRKNYISEYKTPLNKEASRITLAVCISKQSLLSLENEFACHFSLQVFTRRDFSQLV